MPLFCHCKWKMKSKYFVLCSKSFLLVNAKIETNCHQICVLHKLSSIYFPILYRIRLHLMSRLDHISWIKQIFVSGILQILHFMPLHNLLLFFVLKRIMMLDYCNNIPTFLCAHAFYWTLVLTASISMFCMI